MRGALCPKTAGHTESVHYRTLLLTKSSNWASVLLGGIAGCKHSSRQFMTILDSLASMGGLPLRSRLALEAKANPAMDLVQCGVQKDHTNANKWIKMVHHIMNHIDVPHFHLHP